MNIGVDVDGVLSDVGKFLRETGGEYFPRKFGLELVDPAQNHVEPMFGCTKKQKVRFWWDCGWQYLWRQGPMDGCPEVIKRLMDEGNGIYIITSRALTTKHGFFPALSRFLLRRWLKKNDIGYSKLIFCSEDMTAADKLEACRENAIDVMIDDTAENLLAIKDHIMTICLESPWNEDLDDERIIMARDWEDIGRAIESL